MNSRRGRLWTGLVLTVALVATLSGGFLWTRSQAQAPRDLARSPKELLANFDTELARIQQVEAQAFWQAFNADNQAEVRQMCDTLIKEARKKGFERRGTLLPRNCGALETRLPVSRDRYWQVGLQDQADPALNATIIAASLETDTHLGQGSGRGFFDIWVSLDPGEEDQGFAQLTLTNLWSDQPEVIKRATSGLRFNGESRFYVDIARVVGGGIWWYRYWWFDSHHHPWWWYGGYWAWWWYYRWYGAPWFWWWHWWWPWWHWWHFWSWSTWWADLNP